jgi:hypothetical protein
VGKASLIMRLRPFLLWLLLLLLLLLLHVHTLHRD